MIKFEVKDRYSSEVKFIADIDCSEDDPRSLKLRLAVLWAIINDANLSSADLSSADLSSANLSYADLSSADLSYADLSSANLSDADLRYADLSDADLRYADLHYADLRSFKHDVWAVCAYAVYEVPNLIKAIKNGEIDGSQYEGECCCLCGTLEKGLKSKIDIRDASSPAEQWFSMISEGDTPDDNQVSKIALEWVEEFYNLVKGKKQ